MGSFVIDTSHYSIEARDCGASRCDTPAPTDMVLDDCTPHDDSIVEHNARKFLTASNVSSQKFSLDIDITQTRVQADPSSDT